MGGRAARGGRLKIRVVSFGKDRSGLFLPAVEEYAKRLGHYVKLELVELPARRTRDEEAEVLLSKLLRTEALIALDERGKALSSVELSSAIAKAQERAGDLLFAIGGDEGHGEAVLKQASWTLSLSRMTLPHRLARVVLLEQLYRAFTLLRGEPYHRA